MPDRARRLIGAAVVAAALIGCGSGGGAARRVKIPPRATFGIAADSLSSAGIIRFPRIFSFYAKLRGSDRSIKAGTYLLEPGQSWGQVLSALAEGRGLEHTVTIPEGFAIADMAPLLARTLGTRADSVLVAVEDSSLRQRLDVPTPTLEGYLFPDTYRFMYGTSARAAVAEMVRRFEQIWEDGWDHRLQELGMSRHEILTLASIVEKEARLAEERPVIAAVYHNRLRIGMPLQADPTVQYALGEHRSRVLYRDLQVESPYNTYRRRGLPPGPIASPGRASIVAALFPANVPYRYFVAHPDGHHEFRVTFREHTEARRAVQGGAQRRSEPSGRRSPSRRRG